MNYAELTWWVVGEILMVATALVVLGLDLKVRNRLDLAGRRVVALTTGVAGCGATVMWLAVAGAEGAVLEGMFVSDPLTRLIKGILVGLTAGTLLLSSRITFTAHVGEYVALVLFGAVGMMLIVSSENALMMFLALELTSLSLYTLAGFDKRDARCAEAALKYFLFGGMAGAFLLFGLSLVYGVTGSIEFGGIAAGTAGQETSPLLLAGLVMVLVGLGFKVAAAPFHFWAPDAYEGAPTPAAGFIAAGSKVAAFFILAKFTVTALPNVAGSGGWGQWAPGWLALIAVVAVASMVWGNLAALWQRNVKRLLAYSAVAQAGYTLVAVVAGGPESMPAVLYYATTYAVTALGAFGVVGMVEKGLGGSDFEHFAGLMRRSPVAAVCLGVFVLSLAGIPPLAGFFGKLYLFLVALESDGGNLGLLWLVAVGAATTCVSFYYYLRLLKAVFVEEPAGESRPWPRGAAESVTIGLAALVVLAVGCVPALLLAPLHGALVAVGL